LTSDFLGVGTVHVCGFVTASKRNAAGNRVTETYPVCQKKNSGTVNRTTSHTRASARGARLGFGVRMDVTTDPGSTLFRWTNPTNTSESNCHAVIPCVFITFEFEYRFLLTHATRKVFYAPRGTHSMRRNWNVQLKRNRTGGQPAFSMPPSDARIVAKHSPVQSFTVSK
jgi:hypothetical protein